MKTQRVRDSLRASLWDGIFASCMLGLTAEYITPYALALNAKVYQIGILSALPNLFSSLVQLKSADFTERIGSRKKVIVFFVLLHALMALPIILAPYLFKGFEVITVIFFVILFTSFNAFVAPVWLGMMSDYLPVRKRGAYFGWRNKILGVINICSIFLAGFILYLFEGRLLKGFFIIFSMAFFCRLISWYFLTKMHEPPLRVKKEDYFSFIDFIRRARESNFAKFVFFVSAFNFAVNLSAPFVSVFMLKDLKFNYITYTILIMVVSISTIFTIGRWGRNADRIGNLKILKLCSWFICCLPFFWIISQRPGYLFFVQMIGGMVWAGFNLCAINFIYDAASPAKRMRCISYFNVFNGVALCLGALAGGYLAKQLPNLFGYRLLTLFFLSGFLRLVVVSVFSGKIKEVRATEHISSKDLFFSVMGIKPVLGISPNNE